MHDCAAPREPALHATRRRQRRSTIAMSVGVLIIVVVAVGRFLTVGGASEPAPQAVRASILGEQVTALEARVAGAPEDLDAWQALGTLYVRRANQTADPAFYALAEEAFDRADDLQQGAPFTLVGRGTLALALHDFRTALELGQRARRALDDNGDALAIIVDAEVELGHYDAAADRLEELLELRPDAAALARVSYLRELHGDLPGAVAAMSSARAAISASAFDEATVAALLGDLLLDMGDAAAADAYVTALESSSGLIPAEIGLARIEAADGDLAGAIERLERVVTDQPQPAALMLLAELHRLAGDADEAAAADELVRAVARLQESAGQAVDLEMAVFEADRGDDPDRAVSLARQAYDARPDNIFAADALAWALHRAGRSEHARPLTDDALRLGTQDPQLRYHAAAILAAVGEDEEAREHLRAVADTNPWFSFAHLEAAGELAADLGVDAPSAWLRP